MKYYIADTHFNHHNILEYENRPFNSVTEMDEELIKRWNSRVKDKDEVYILGDFCFDNSGKYANEILDKLNGKKYLIKGNYDSFLNNKNFDQSKFEWIKDYAEIKDNGLRVILFHYPIASWNAKIYGTIHLYGHIHSHKLEEAVLINAYNVGADVQDFYPLTLKEILKKNGQL